MFEKKQIIYSETQGVCQVENIVSLSASRRERKICLLYTSPSPRD